MKIAIVAPCHIPPSKDWISSLQREAKVGNADVFIVDDSNGKLGDLPPEWRVFMYADQREFLEELYEEFANIFHKSSACRVLGHIYAYAAGYDVVIGLDSDCIVPFNFVEDHLKSLNTKMNGGWINPLSGSGLYPRGFPYSMRNWKTVANMGMWENVLDLNGKDRNPHEPKRIATAKFNAPAPIPFSGMNFAITKEALFGFLFLPNFEYVERPAMVDGKEVNYRWQFRRIDDIWGGYIFQKLLNKLRLGVTYGMPVVWHDTVVIAAEDAAEEEAMYKYEDEFMAVVDSLTHFTAIDDERLPVDINILMIQFIEEWKKYIDQGKTFFDLNPAFEWWAKVIKKYTVEDRV
jgi:hypothetical protein